MRHRKAGRKLGRNSSHRKAMYRNMATALMMHGRIKTTEAKAKELRRYAERVITLGKRIPPSTIEELDGEERKAAEAKRLHNIRRARRMMPDKDALHLVFNDYAERFKHRPGGYTRVIKAGYRAGDNARMAVIELVEAMEPPSSEDAGALEEEEVAAAAPEAAEAAAEE